MFFLKNAQQGLAGGSAVNSLPANSGDTGPSPDLGTSHMPHKSIPHASQEADTTEAILGTYIAHIPLKYY